MAKKKKTRKEYRVRWEVDIDATSRREAAQKALEMQRDSQSTATVFDVVLSSANDRFANDPDRLRAVTTTVDL